MEGAGLGPAHGPAAQRRRRRPGGPGGARGRAPGGDGLSDRVQVESYRYWKGQLGRSDFRYGQFGENFTVEGLADDKVCIGDRYRIGDALFEVTQPRVTCYRVGIRTDEPRMAALLASHRRPGFYFRVLEEGEVGAGDEIVKVADGPERMTVVESDALPYLPGHTREQLERALRIAALSPRHGPSVGSPDGRLQLASRAVRREGCGMTAEAVAGFASLAKVAFRIAKTSSRPAKPCTSD